jgi:L,D-transpeptidase YcbB
MSNRHGGDTDPKTGKRSGRGRRRPSLAFLAAALIAAAAVSAARPAAGQPAATAAAGGETSQEPLYAGIAGLEAARAALAAQVAAGGWPRVGPGKVLRPGEDDPRVPVLRRRLAAGGDLPAGGDAAGDIYDPPLEAAVLRFQQRHGLLVDGIIGRATLAALDTPAAERLRQIDANLERRRRLPVSLGDRYLLVNLPAFRLEAVDKGRPVLAMDVVVGRPSMPSPEVASTITHLVVNPFWNVPASIARRELAPRESSEPGYLGSLGIRVFSAPGGEGELAPDEVDWLAVARGEQRLYLRQEPGQRNSLGRLSLQMPNDDDICLHDTPDKSAFGRSRRALSHGCIRLADAAALAAYLLRDDPAWTFETLTAAIAGGNQREIRLASPMPIYLVYWTAWIAADGTLELREDVYRRDGLGARALAW